MVTTIRIHLSAVSIPWKRQGVLYIYLWSPFGMLRIRQGVGINANINLRSTTPHEWGKSFEALEF